MQRVLIKIKEGNIKNEEKKKGLVTLMVADMSRIVCILGERKGKRQILDL